MVVVALPRGGFGESQVQIRESNCPCLTGGGVDSWCVSSVEKWTNHSKSGLSRVLNNAASRMVDQRRKKHVFVGNRQAGLEGDGAAREERM